MSTTPFVEKASQYRLVIVAVLFIGIAVAYMDRVNVSVLAANDIFLTDLGIKGQPVRIGMLMSLFLAFYGAANIAAGWLGDWLGARKAMMISIAMWIASLVLGGLAASFAMMLVARVILGIGEGFYYPLQSVLVKQWIPPKERGKANAAWSIGQSVAPAVAMPFLSYVIALWGWRESFHILVPVTLVPLLMLYFLVTDKPEDCRKVNAEELALIKSSIGPDVSVEAKKESLWQRFKPIAANYRYWLLVYWYLALNLIYWGLITWLPSYLKNARGFSWKEVGWLSSLPFVLTIITKAYVGWQIDKVGRYAYILMAGMFIGAGCIYTATVVQNNYAAAAALACASACTSMGLPAAWTLLQNLVPSHSMATAGGVMTGLSTGISSLSPVLIGFFIYLSGGNFSGGLYMLIGVATSAGIATAILAAQKY